MHEGNQLKAWFHTNPLSDAFNHAFCHGTSFAVI